MTSERFDAIWEPLPIDRFVPDYAARVQFLRAHIDGVEALLDLGCGDGVFTAAIEAEIEAVGVDVSSVAVTRARARSPQARFDLLQEDHVTLPLEDSTVDVVWASEILQHVSDLPRLLSETRRVLRPGGSLLVTVPNHSIIQRLTAFHDFDGKFGPYAGATRSFTRRSLSGLIDDFGFMRRELNVKSGSLYCWAEKPRLNAR